MPNEYNDSRDTERPDETDKAVGLSPANHGADEIKPTTGCKCDKEKSKLAHAAAPMRFMLEISAPNLSSGDKCWFARDLMDLLQYDKWDKFERVIGKAKTACRNSGHDPDDHFKEVIPQPGKNPEGGRPARNYEL